MAADPILLVTFFYFVIAASFAAAQSADLPEALEQTTKTAIAKVAPTLVQIQTVGGRETLDRGGRGAPPTFRGQGPTTGVIVSPDGFIISSSFNFAHKPSAITVTLPDGKLLNAKLVAHDHTRMLTLLKVEAAGLPVPEAAPRKDIKIGQWVVALGKSWSSPANPAPSVSVGIISALERIWGKAVQTDAKVSPVNYGGTLIDLQGRVIGVLVPLSPRAEGEVAGLEWYDAGIGFAVPLEDINRVLPKLKAGKDLKRGVLGVSLPSADMMDAAPVIGNVAPNSTAAKAGIQVGDQIIEVDAKAVARQAQIMHILGPKYEGDTVSLKIKRGEQTIDLPNLQLMGEPTSHAHAFLGILPMRDDPAPGVEIRYVYPKSPAEAAGLKVGDRILKVEGRPFPGRDALTSILNASSPGMKVKFEVRRKEGDKTETITATLAQLPETIPDQLPSGTHKKALAPRQPLPGQPPRPMAPQEKPAEKKDAPKDARKGHFTNTDATTGRQYWAYVPENYDPNVSHALLVWLHPAGDPFETPLLQMWQEFCKENHIILLGPKAENRTGWITSEVDFIKADIRAMLEPYTIDRQRIVLHGQNDGGDLALYLGFDARNLVRGVAAVGGTLRNPPKETAPNLRLSLFLAAGARDPAIEGLRTTKQQLLDKRYPVVYREIPNHAAGYLPTADSIRELVRWIDSLDRL